MNIPSLTVAEIQQGLQARSFSAAELATEALRFAEAENPKTNAYLLFCPERALAAAAQIDELVAKGGLYARLSRLQFQTTEQAS